MTQREDYKFGLGYSPTPEEVTKVREEAHARKVVAQKWYQKHYTIKPYPHTFNGDFIHKGGNFPLYGFP